MFVQGAFEFDGFGTVELGCERMVRQGRRSRGANCDDREASFSRKPRNQNQRIMSARQGQAGRSFLNYSAEQR